MKVTFICLSLENTPLLSQKMLEARTIDLSYKTTKVRSSFLRPFAVVTDTTDCSGFVPSALQSPGVLAACI